MLYEDRSRLAMLYLWLAQRFPDVYTNREEVALIRESLDDDIHSACSNAARGPVKRRPLPKPVRRAPRPRDFGPRRRR